MCRAPPYCCEYIRVIIILLSLLLFITTITTIATDIIGGIEGQDGEAEAVSESSLELPALEFKGS
jgi:hypothetical protein